ncbi:MAG: hypothetical protein K2X46_11960, partial [Roseomonas sp.]|nr:hypothetical protein [Roseomonas sp.]
WEPLPDPTGDLNAAARLRPDGWDYGVRCVSGKAMGWCADPRNPLRFTEQNRLTPPRALTCAGLFARRMIAMGG